MDRRKELKEQYKNMKPEMGIFIIKAKFNDKCLIESSKDLKGTINGSKFRLNAGNYLNADLQSDWKEYGKNGFTIEILENLQYDKDELKMDYSEELEILKLIWIERLSSEKMEFYNES